MPSRCVCDRSRVYLFPIFGKKHVKRLECACRTKKDRSEAWGESVPKQRGPTQVGILGVGRSIDTRCSSTSQIMRLFHRSQSNNKPTVLISPSTTASRPLKSLCPVANKKQCQEIILSLGRIQGGVLWFLQTLP